MRREDLQDLLNRIPAGDLTRTQMIMRSGPPLAIDTIIRYEPNYLVMRGREAGNQDEGRGFFVPYDEVVVVKIERVLKGVELEEMFSDKGASGVRKMVVPAGETSANGTPNVTSDTPKPSAPLDPASIAKQNLLDRIRAAKSVNR